MKLSELPDARRGHRQRGSGATLTLEPSRGKLQTACGPRMETAALSKARAAASSFREGAQVVVLARLPDARLPLAARLVQGDAPEAAAVLHHQLLRLRHMHARISLWISDPMHH